MARSQLAGQKVSKVELKALVPISTAIQNKFLASKEASSLRANCAWPMRSVSRCHIEASQPRLRCHDQFSEVSAVNTLCKSVSEFPELGINWPLCGQVTRLNRSGQKQLSQTFEGTSQAAHELAVATASCKVKEQLWKCRAKVPDTTIARLQQRAEHKLAVSLEFCYGYSINQCSPSAHERVARWLGLKRLHAGLEFRRFVLNAKRNQLWFSCKSIKHLE